MDWINDLKKQSGIESIKVNQDFFLFEVSMVFSNCDINDNGDSFDFGMEEVFIGDSILVYSEDGKNNKEII